MRQVVQHIRTGSTIAREVPDPVAGPHEVLVDVRASLISAGTERYVVDLTKKSLVEKAVARPNDVRRVLQKLRQEGLVATARQVRAKLEEAIPLGNSAAGIVLEAGRSVQDFKPGDRVALAAPHAGVVATGANLCAPIPEGVDLEHAAYAGVAAIALQGVRLSEVGLGGRVLVIGLGLIGQLTLCFLKAQSCKVYGFDPDEARVRLALRLGADGAGSGSPSDGAMAMSDGLGVDACIITAATDSNEPIELAAELCRPKGRIVMVGVAGMEIPRQAFFRKELELVVSNSLGAGRTDRRYEEKGQDYPIGYARWTVQRNMRAALETMANGHLPVDELTTHRFDIEQATQAYELITSDERHLGVVFRYPAALPVGETQLRRRVDLPVRARSRRGSLGVSVVGAGNYARLTLLPALATLSDVERRGICSAHGVNAVSAAESKEFGFATTDVEELLGDTETEAVFIATRHDSHADLALRCLQAGKHVFVEKPLCLTLAELAALDALLQELAGEGPILSVGFNRRFAPAVQHLGEAFRAMAPVSVSYRFGAGEVAPDAWPHDDDIGGGRLIGDAIHAIDTCTAIADSPPVRVFAESTGMVGGTQTTDDRVAITMRHANGSISSIFYQAGNDKGGPKERIEVFGGGQSGFVEDFGTVELWRDGRATTQRFLRNKGHHAGVRAFIDGCRTQRRPIPHDHVLGASWAALMAVRSLRDGMPVARTEAEG